MEGAPLPDVSDAPEISSALAEGTSSVDGAPDSARLTAF